MRTIDAEMWELKHLYYVIFFLTESKSIGAYIKKLDLRIRLQA
jgi:hypothetical protein